MSMWQNAAKHAKSFGIKGFLYGAVIGAVVGVAALLMVAGAVSTLGALGIVSSTIAGGGALEMAGAGAQILANGLAAIDLPLVAAIGGGGAVAGSVIGAVGCATAGGIYGAAVDETNPLPRVLDATANKIISKTPELAKAIAHKVSLQEEASQQLAAQGGVQAAAVEAPVITQSVAEAPATQTNYTKQQPAVSFQERVVATQAKEAELAAAQR